MTLPQPPQATKAAGQAGAIAIFGGTLLWMARLVLGSDLVFGFRESFLSFNGVSRWSPI
jgi:hypothetical protein